MVLESAILALVIAILVAGFVIVYREAGKNEAGCPKQREPFEYCECCGKKIRGAELHEYCCEGFGLCRKCYKKMSKE